MQENHLSILKDKEIQSPKNDHCGSADTYKHHHVLLSFFGPICKWNATRKAEMDVETLA